MHCFGSLGKQLQARRRVAVFERLDDRRVLASVMDCETQDTGDWPADFNSASIATYATQADPGSTQATALNLGDISGNRTIYGSVGGRDPSDVLKFSVSGKADVTILLNGLRVDIDLALYNSSGRQIALSNQSGTQSESISQLLDAGTYYILVDPYRWSQSPYTLKATAILESATQPTPANPATANPTTAIPVPSYPDVAYYGGANDWNVNYVNAPEAWAQGYTGQGTLVAVIDTGVDLDHYDLDSQIWVNPGEIPNNGLDDDQNGYVDDIHGWDFVNNDNVPDDMNGHGTHVAGTIAAERNGSGATGVAYGATILPVRVLDANGSGTSNSVAAGIRYAAQVGSDIINLSLGGSFSYVIQSAIDYARQLDVLVVIASGNEYATTPAYPARHSSTMSNVISVGAYDSSDRQASFSNGVGNSNAVQVDAPGVSIYSTFSGGGFSTYSGTSMATPHVAAVAALALSANPSLSAEQLRTVIVAGATQSAHGSDARGKLNAATTVALAEAGSATRLIAATSTTSQATNSWSTWGQFGFYWMNGIYSIRVAETVPTWEMPGTSRAMVSANSGAELLVDAKESPLSTFDFTTPPLSIRARFFSESISPRPPVDSASNLPTDLALASMFGDTVRT